jgi:hypothetical protein
MLQTVAIGLEELKDEMVFVGGLVIELYAKDPAASDIRPTLDIDCIIELSSRIAHIGLEEKLRTKGFVHDLSPEALICRWNYQNIKVDVMTTDEDILGFSNQWYHEGFSNKITKTLSNEVAIFVFSPEYYLASKFEAHNSRGGNDLRQSHDFEDIIYIFDNCPEILDNIKKGNSGVKGFLKLECQSLLDNSNLTEGIESALPYGSGYERTEMIVDLIRKIAL